MECIFPDELDNARVLFYTPKGDYGKMDYDYVRSIFFVKSLTVNDNVASVVISANDVW